MSLGVPISLRRPLVVVMVGLPARGKTYIARKLARYLTWTGYQAEVFNVGNYRREQFGAQVPASFFDPTNPDGLQSRRAHETTVPGARTCHARALHRAKGLDRELHLRRATATKGG